MLYSILPSLVVYPLLAGIVCLALPDRAKGITKVISFLVTLSCLAGSLFIFMIKPISWQAGAYKIFAVDNLSALTGLSVAFFAFLISLYSSTFIDKAFGRYFGYFLITLGSALGVAFAGDLVTLAIFWGMLAVTLYLLVGIKGTDDASRAAKKTLIMVGGTDALLIFGISLIWALSGTFTIDRIHLDINSALSMTAYIARAIAAFAKAGVVPLHSWLPDASEHAPTSVAAYLPASLDKLLGIYLLARASLGLFSMNGATNTMLALIGASAIMFGAVFALQQRDMKRLLGYSSIAQAGYVVLGIGTANAIGICGAIFHVLNHAIYKSCLFLSAGNVEKRAGTTDLDRLGGLAKFMPATFSTFLIASLSISAIPPLNGFVSKWMIYQGIIESASPKNPLWVVWLAVALFGSALTMASFMKLLHAVFLGRSGAGPGHAVREAGFSMLFPAIVLAATCLVFGIFAFLLPLPILIIPATGLTPFYAGIWSPIAATLLIAAGVAAGVLLYMALGKKAFRTVKAFVGGEDADSLGRISGTAFYNTIDEVKGLNALYRKEALGAFDIYNIAQRIINYFTGWLKGLHNGVLPTYMVWCLIGMAAIFLIVFFR